MSLGYRDCTNAINNLGRFNQEETLLMQPETHYPLPPKQYRRYAIFWSILMVGSLIGALTFTLWQARTALSWREIVVALLLLAQIGSYAVLVGRATFPPQRRLLVYFAANLCIWLVEYWLVPDIWWIVFAYVGQMFGMLPAKIARCMVRESPTLMGMPGSSGFTPPASKMITRSGD